MAMSPRKKMAMGKGADGKMKSAVKLRGGGMVKKMAKGGSANAPKKSPRPTKRPFTMDEAEALERGNRAAARGMRKGGMVKK